MNSDTTLSHYGVVGMKWGVRRYQPYPKGKHGTFLGQDRDRDIRIPKGTEGFRLQLGKELKPGHAYVSFDRLDHYKYIEATAAKDKGLVIDLNDGEGNSLRMVADRDIVAPSYKKSMDAFIKTVSDVSGMEDAPKNRREFYKLYEQYGKEKVTELLDQSYLDFFSTIMKDDTGRKIFFDNLKKKGYNAVVDEHDAKFGKGFTDSPTIVFDSSDLKVTSAKEISKKDVEYFSKLYNGHFDNFDPIYDKGVERMGLTDTRKYWVDFVGEEQPRKITSISAS